MEEIRIVDMKIIYDSEKPHLCNTKCDYCRLDNVLHPDNAFCDFYREFLLTQLDYKDFSKVRIERCNSCKADSINKKSQLKID